MVRKFLIFGDADTVGERIAEAVALGIDGIAVDRFQSTSGAIQNMPFWGPCLQL